MSTVPRGKSPDGRLLALEGEVRRLLMARGMVDSPDGTRWMLTVSNEGTVSAMPAHHSSTWADRA